MVNFLTQLIIINNYLDNNVIYIIKLKRKKIYYVLGSR